MAKFPAYVVGADLDSSAMTHDAVQAWLDRYLDAWASNDGATIGELFTDDAVYSYRPWEDDELTPRGRDAIVAAWLKQAIDPSLWEAHYEPYVVEGNKAVAVGWTRYQPIGEHPAKTYHNAYLLEFAEDGRCSSFHEYWVQQKS